MTIAAVEVAVPDVHRAAIEGSRLSQPLFHVVGLGDDLPLIEAPRLEDHRRLLADDVLGPLGSEGTDIRRRLLIDPEETHPVDGPACHHDGAGPFLRLKAGVGGPPREDGHDHIVPGGPDDRGAHPSGDIEGVAPSHRAQEGRIHPGSTDETLLLGDGEEHLQGRVGDLFLFDL